MQSGRDFLNAWYRVLRIALGVAMHFVLCMIGVLILSNLLIPSLYSLAHIWFPSVTSRQVHWILTEVHGFPVQAALGRVIKLVICSGFVDR